MYISAPKLHSVNLHVVYRQKHDLGNVLLNHVHSRPLLKHKLIISTNLLFSSKFLAPTLLRVFSLIVPPKIAIFEKRQIGK